MFSAAHYFLSLYNKKVWVLFSEDLYFLKNDSNEFDLQFYSSFERQNTFSLLFLVWVDSD
jgi:hypothetical protein